MAETKNVLIVDDEIGLVEPLIDALESEGYVVLKATSAESALKILESTPINLICIDIMMPAGESLEDTVSSHEAGLYLCKKVSQEYSGVDAFCLSVVSDQDTIKIIEGYGVKFLRKGETPLRTVLNMFRSRLTGIAYSTSR